MITIHHDSCADLIERTGPGGIALVHLDPPWAYLNFSASMHGAAAAYYDGLPLGTIAEHMHSTYRIAAKDAYCVVWCTFPKLVEWVAAWENQIDPHTPTWQYVTGCTWGKTNGLGVGFHVRGDSELALIYKKGKPKPHKCVSNLWLAPRIGHSEKPQIALRALVELATNRGEKVLDLYAGASASMARACRALGRKYEGAEIDEARHAQALRRLSFEEQAEMGLSVCGATAT